MRNKVVPSAVAALALFSSFTVFAQKEEHGAQRDAVNRVDSHEQVQDERAKSQAKESHGRVETRTARDFRRGDRLPNEYRSRQYVVDDWHGHGLHAPQRGYQWVQRGNDYILVAIASGVIAEILLSH